jgi:hypothetical protein
MKYLYLLMFCLCLIGLLIITILLYPFLGINFCISDHEDNPLVKVGIFLFTKAEKIAKLL